MVRVNSVRALLGASLLLAMPAFPAAAKAPAWRLAKHVSLELKTEPPGFVCLHGLTMLDRGHLVNLGRPLSDRQGLVMLDLKTLEVRTIRIPDWEGGRWPEKGALDPGQPLYYDTENGRAGVVMRRNGRVADDAVLLEWDLRSNRVVRLVDLAPGAGSRWTSVKPIGYDPDLREVYIEIVRCLGDLETPHKPEGMYNLSVLGVSDSVRTIASFDTKLRYTGKSPYFDPVHRRSMHVEYAEYKGSISTAYLVDFGTGKVRSFPLPTVIYGFAFDPDGRTGYVYTETTGEVFKLDLGTGKEGARRKFGRRAHLLDWIGPNTLVLGRNRGMHFLDSRTLRQKYFLDPAAFHKGSTHLEGSVFLPGRALVRIFYELYVIDFPGSSAGK